MTAVTDLQPDWRQRKKAATRERIRGSALRLFREQGYDATTVEQIAAAAGVSHMTFFRYFPAKEDVALSDSYDPMIAALLEQTPATWPLPRRIRAALLRGLQQVYDSDRDALLAQNTLIVSTPVLRERLWAGQMATQEAILQALGPRADFQARVITAACLAAASTAVLTWVQNNGTPELPDLINQAFETLANWATARTEGSALRPGGHGRLRQIWMPGLDPLRGLTPDLPAPLRPGAVPRGASRPAPRGT